MICGRRFSFITIASIDFWSDLQLIFLHFNACILPSIIRHTVVYAVWYGVWFLMVWPWFGHSSLNHNEYAVSSAVSRMKMPPYGSTHPLYWLLMGEIVQITPEVTGDRGLLYFPRRSRGKYSRPTVSSQRGELFCTISRLKSSQYLFYVMHKKYSCHFISSLKRKMLNTISQNANPESQMPVPRPTWSP